MPRSSCATIIDDMEKSQRSEMFGPKSDPTPQVILPVVLKSSTFPISPLADFWLLFISVAVGDGKSSVRVFGTSDITSWYQIWEAVMLVY